MKQLVFQILRELRRSLELSRMNRPLTLIGFLFIAVAALTSQNSEYFPNHVFEAENKEADDFKVQWYTKHLRALKEPSLFELSKSGAHVYRFLWLRSFDNPIAVRVNINGDGTSLLTLKIGSGQGGYEPRALKVSRTRKLSKDETDLLLNVVNEKDYWSLPTEETPDPNVVGVDGAQWVIEGVRNKKYKVVDRWSPETGAVHTIGIVMLINLAKLKLLYQEVY